VDEVELYYTRHELQNVVHPSCSRDLVVQLSNPTHPATPAAAVGAGPGPPAGPTPAAAAAVAGGPAVSRREPAATAWEHHAVVRVAPAQQGTAPALSLSIARSYHRRLQSHHNWRQQVSQPPAPEPGVAPAEGLQNPPRGTPHHPRSRSRVARRDRLPRRSKEVRLALVQLHLYL